MDFHGTQQTCYADWGKCLFNQYPDIDNLKYNLIDNKVEVFHQGIKIAYFNFFDGSGNIVQPKSTSEIKNKYINNYELLNIENMIKK